MTRTRNGVDYWWRLRLWCAVILLFGTTCRAQNCSFTCGSGSETWKGARIGFPVRPHTSLESQVPLYYSGYPAQITAQNNPAKNAFVLLGHNMSQTETMFCQMLLSDTFQAQASSAVIIAVQLLPITETIGPSCAVAQNSSKWLTWPSTRSWVNGFESLKTSDGFNASSYTVIDNIVSALKDTFYFPNLDTITFTGFGDGAEVFFGRFITPCCLISTSSILALTADIFFVVGVATVCGCNVRVIRCHAARWNRTSLCSRQRRIVPLRRLRARASVRIFVVAVRVGVRSIMLFYSQRCECELHAVTYRATLLQIQTTVAAIILLYLRSRLPATPTPAHTRAFLLSARATRFRACLRAQATTTGLTVNELLQNKYCGCMPSAVIVHCAGVSHLLIAWLTGFDNTASLPYATAPSPGTFVEAHAHKVQSSHFHRMSRSALGSCRRFFIGNGGWC